MRKFTTDGQLLMTLGEKDRPADTGFQEGASPVRRAGGPFNRGTNVSVVPDGEMYVSDGYGNARVHKFSADGELLLSWVVGKPVSVHALMFFVAHRRYLAPCSVMPRP